MDERRGCPPTPRTNATAVDLKVLFFFFLLTSREGGDRTAPTNHRQTEEPKNKKKTPRRPAAPYSHQLGVVLARAVDMTARLAHDRVAVLVLLE